MRTQHCQPGPGAQGQHTVVLEQDHALQRRVEVECLVLRCVDCLGANVRERLLLKRVKLPHQKPVCQHTRSGLAQASRGDEATLDGRLQQPVAAVGDGREVGLAKLKVGAGRDGLGHRVQRARGVVVGMHHVVDGAAVGPHHDPRVVPHAAHHVVKEILVRTRGHAIDGSVAAHSQARPGREAATVLGQVRVPQIKQRDVERPALAVVLDRVCIVVLEPRDHLEIRPWLQAHLAPSHIVCSVLPGQQRVLAGQLRVAAKAWIADNVDVGTKATQPDERARRIAGRAVPVEIVQSAHLGGDHVALGQPQAAIEACAEAGGAGKLCCALFGSKAGACHGRVGLNKVHKLGNAKPRHTSIHKVARIHLGFDIGPQKPCDLGDGEALNKISHALLHRQLPIAKGKVLADVQATPDISIRESMHLCEQQQEAYHSQRPRHC
eukprot:m.223587 g.223587  ORF g.223587 m.223587 type:complete len:436 (+) comp16277_c0_seq1:1803-3110(+)